MYVIRLIKINLVVWDPYSEVYQNDIESIKKQFVMYSLGDINRIPPFRLRRKMSETRIGKTIDAKNKSDGDVGL